jgi:hypothetical protein
MGSQFSEHFNLQPDIVRLFHNITNKEYTLFSTMKLVLAFFFALPFGSLSQNGHVLRGSRHDNIDHSAHDRHLGMGGMSGGGMGGMGMAGKMETSPTTEDNSGERPPYLDVPPGFDPSEHVPPHGTTPDCSNPTYLSSYYYELSQMPGMGPEMRPCLYNSDCDGYRTGGAGGGDACCVFPQCLCAYPNPVANNACSIV